MPDQKIYDKLTTYCAYQERSAKDVKQKLVKLKAEPDDTAYYLERLQRENYLNETRFAKAFIEGHLRKKWGKAKIKAALAQKGIAANTVKNLLDDVEDEGYAEQLLAAATHKLKSIKGETEYDRKIKLTRFLLSKGYESSRISTVVKQLFAK